MRVIWCPHPELLKMYRGREKEVLAGVTEMQQDQEAVDADGRVKGRVRKIDDGWAELLKTLVDFPYQKYGIGA